MLGGLVKILFPKHFMVLASTDNTYLESVITLRTAKQWELHFYMITLVEIKKPFFRRKLRGDQVHGHAISNPRERIQEE